MKKILVLAVILIVVVVAVVGGLIYSIEKPEPQYGPDNSRAIQSRVIWAFKTNNPSWVLVLDEISDVDGDGVGDIAAGSYNYDQTVYLISGKSGRLIWSYTPSQSSGIYALTKIKSINHDDLNDVVVGVIGGPGRVQALNGANGALLWSYEVNHSNINDVEEISDVDGDNINDVIVSTGGSPSGPDNRVLVLNGRSGELIWDYYLGDSGVGNAKDIEVIEDVNGDGIADVIAGTYGSVCPGPGSGSTFLFSGTSGDIIWSRSPNFGVLVDTISGIHNLADEDVLSAASCEFGIGDSYLYRLGGEDGEIIWQYENSLCPDGSEFYLTSSIGDVNGDSREDAVVISTPAGPFGCDGGISLIDGESGTLVWQLQANAGGHKPTTDTDFNGDGISDVLVSLELGSEYEESLSGEARAINGKDGRILWSFDIYHNVISNLGVKDLNSNGRNDAIIGADGYVIALEGGELKEFHSECVNNRCVSIEGSGFNECYGKGPGNCLDQTHFGCVTPGPNACTVINGPGESTCFFEGDFCS